MEGVIRNVFVGLVLLICMRTDASGALLEMPLPDLCGDYATSAKRTAVVMLDLRPARVHAVALYLEGVATRGIKCCNPGRWECYYIGLPLAARILDDPEAYAELVSPDTSGPWGSSGPFAVPAGAEWDSLRAGRTAVSLEASAMALPDCILDPGPTVTVTRAALVLDAEFHQTTWGRIRGLYR